MLLLVLLVLVVVDDVALTVIFLCLSRIVKVDSDITRGQECKWGAKKRVKELKLFLQKQSAPASAAKAQKYKEISAFHKK